MNWLRSRGGGGRDDQSNGSASNTGIPSAEPDAAELRRRRLAKLEALQKNAAAQQQTGDGEAEKVAKERAEREKRELERKEREKREKEEQERSEKERLQRKRKRGPIAEKSKEWWASELIERVLGVTMKESSTGGRVYLADLGEELLAIAISKGEEEPLFALDHTDDIILKMMGQESEFLVFMLKCSERVDKCRAEVLSENRRLSLPQNSELKVSIGKTLDGLLQRLLMYTGLSLSGSMMEAQNTTPEKLAELLIADKVPSGFIPNLVDWYTTEEGLGKEEMTQVFVKVFNEIKGQMEGAKISQSNWMPPLRALTYLINSKTRDLCFVLTSNPNFLIQDEMLNVSSPGLAYMRKTYLGPFFQLSVVAGLPYHFPRLIPEDPGVGNMYFSDATSRSKVDVDSSTESLRATLRVYRQYLRHVCKELCRAGGSSREATLQWFGSALNVNRKRAGMQFDPRTVSGDGFMMNMMDVLMHLCEPIIAAGHSKLNLIDATYPQSNLRLNFTDETRLAADSDMLKRWWVDKRNFDAQQSLIHQMKRAEKEAGLDGATTEDGEGSTSEAPKAVSTSFNFVTEIFFLTLRSVQLGFLSLHTFYKDRLLRGLSHIQSEIRMLESQIAREGSSVEQDEELEKAKSQFSSMAQIKLTYDVYMMDKEQLSSLVRFVAADASFLLTVLSTPPREQLLPLPLPPDHTFASLPEHTVEIISTVMLMAARYDMSVVDQNSEFLESMVTFIVAAASSPLHVKNPYLRAKLIEFLYHVVPRVTEDDDDDGHMQSNVAMEALFAGHELASAHLPSTLFKLYVDVELTGSHNQFYDKFSIRYNIGYIIESMWRFPQYRQSMRSDVEDETRFVRFINMVLNDANFLLDETLNDLEEIKQLEDLMVNRTEWGKLTDEEKTEKTERLDQIQRGCASYNLLSGNTLKILVLLTGDDAIKKVFMRSEMISRLVEMLNYFLTKLCGKKCRNLKVADADKVKWKPRVLLRRILGIYINFSDDIDFAKAVAKDGRSYSDELFSRVGGIAQNTKLLNTQEVAKFKNLADNIKEARDDAERDADILGDVPDEFLDPIMSTLMRDPVKLVTSGNVVDRATITRHLLSVPSDPFNRKFLSEDMLEDDVELKARIDEFIRQRKAGEPTK